MQPVLMKVTKLLGTPVFALFSTDLKFAKVFGATRIGDDPLWYYPAFYPLYKIVLRDMKVLKLPVAMSDSAKKVVAQLEQYDERIEKSVLPPGFQFKTTPFEHQRLGLVHILYNMRAALFYACGLGKTKIIVDWQRALSAFILILCPSKVVHVWGHEVARHGIDQEFRLIDAKSKEEKTTQIADAKNYSGIVISYDSARRYADQLGEEVPYNAIVADESHYIKGHTSQRTTVALELSKKTCRRVIMSGTPSTGDPRDMYAQFRFLTPALMPEQFWKFKNTFCITAPMNKRIVVGFKNLDVLNRRVQLVALRKTKKECLDLPEQHVIDIMVDMHAPQQKAYNSLILSDEYNELAEAMLRDEKILTEHGLIDIPNAAILVNKLLQVTCGFVYLKADVPNICEGCAHLRDCVNQQIKPYTSRCLVDTTPVQPVVQRMPLNAKLERLEQKLEEILAEPTHKCIVWGQFHPELDWIEEQFKTNWGEKGYVRVDGSTGNIDTLVKRFNEDPACRLYLGQVETGVGLTLNAANYMVYFSLPWKLLAYDQSIDRNHRVGQRRDVTVFRLLGKGTIDTHVARGLTTKRTVAETIVAVLACANCDRKEVCGERGITLLEAGCKYKREVPRHVARVKAL